MSQGGNDICKATNVDLNVAWFKYGRKESAKLLKWNRFEVRFLHVSKSRSHQSSVCLDSIHIMEDLSTVKFVDTPLKKLPSWIGQNMTSVAGIRRTFGVTFLNFQHAQRYRFPGPIAPLFVICATMGAMVQHEFHEGTKSLFFVSTFL